MEVIRANGLEIAYVRAGDGPPLVLVHGALLDSRSWRPQLDALAGELTVVAWDEPGAGHSSDLPAGFALADYANCLASLIEAIGLGPAHVGGISWGTSVALELYRLHAPLVRTLILAGGYAGWKGSLPEQEVRERVAGARQMLETGGSDPTLPGLLASEPAPEVAALLDEMAADVRRETARIQLQLMAQADLSAVLPRIAVPTSLIWGELDVRSPLTVARRFEEAIPDSELVVIPDCGHLCNLERPEIFNRAVRRFCRAHAPSDA